MNMRDTSQTSRHPILVTGSHRSGSTWVGKTIAAASGVCYIHEPFNLNYGFETCSFLADAQYWYRYVDNASMAEFERAFSDVINYRFPIRANLRSSQNIRDIGRIFWRASRCRQRQVLRPRPLIKDPFALFSAEWLAKTFDMDVIVLIRHPAAFTSSVIKAKWTHPFEHFLAQPELMERFLSPYEREIRSYVEQPRSIIEQAILLWRIIHHVIRIYRDRHPNWYFARHMDLSLEPVEEFETMCQWVDIPFTPDLRSYIIEQTNASNPVETNQLYELNRNSRKNVYSWKTRLSESQIRKIRDETLDLWPAFYSEKDWEVRSETA